MTASEKNESSKPSKKKEGAMTSKKVKVSSKLALVQDVIQLMDASDISEISFEQAGVKIHLRRGVGMPFQARGVRASDGFGSNRGDANRGCGGRRPRRSNGG